MIHLRYNKLKSFKVFHKLPSSPISPSSIITTQPCKSNYGNKETCLEWLWDVKSLIYQTINLLVYRFSNPKTMKINSLEIIDSSRPSQISLVMRKSHSMTLRMVLTTHSLPLVIIFLTNHLICMTIKKFVRLISPSKPIIVKLNILL
jgi:hypothetical protein